MQQHFPRLSRVARAQLVDLALDRRTMRLQLSPPLSDLTLEFERRTLLVTLRTGALQPEIGVEDRSWHSDRVIGPCERDLVADFRVLQIRHMT